MNEENPGVAQPIVEPLLMKQTEVANVVSQDRAILTRRELEVCRVGLMLHARCVCRQHVEPRGSKSAHPVRMPRVLICVDRGKIAAFA